MALLNKRDLKKHYINKRFEFSIRRKGKVDNHILVADSTDWDAIEGEAIDLAITTFYDTDANPPVNKWAGNRMAVLKELFSFLSSKVKWCSYYGYNGEKYKDGTGYGHLSYSEVQDKYENAKKTLEKMRTKLHKLDGIETKQEEIQLRDEIIDYKNNVVNMWAGVYTNANLHYENRVAMTFEELFKQGMIWNNDKELEKLLKDRFPDLLPIYYSENRQLSIINRIKNAKKKEEVQSFMKRDASPAEPVKESEYDKGL